MAGLDPYGIALQRSDMQTTPTFTAIGNVTSVKGPEMERDTYDVTAHDGADNFKTFIGGLVDAGEVTIGINYDPAKHDMLQDDYADTDPRDYKLVFPPSGGGGEWDLKLILTKFSFEAPVDDKWTGELTFKVSGKPVITTGA